MNYRLLGFAFLIPLLVSGPAGTTERLACPKERSLDASRSEWEAAYSGPIERVTVSGQFAPAGPTITVIRCDRAVGSMQIVLEKSCRIARGSGSVDKARQDAKSGSDVCSPAGPGPVFDNGEQCVVECD